MNEHSSNPNGAQETLDQVILAYLRQAEAGQAPDPRQWLDRYPEFAGELAEFFATEARFHAMRAPLDLPAVGHAREKVPRGSCSTEVVPSHAPLADERYFIDRFYARGGMGEVWIARDAKIGRRVAVKRIRQHRLQYRDRFLLEAQITGQLEHPGIVPLHDVGVDSSGRPFYVMKLVRGVTLKEVIADYHAHARRTGSADHVQQLRLLNVFLDLCQTIGYAHSRGVVHRDLKPDNVMLGEYGETLVLDWGLAKLRDAAELPEERSQIRLSAEGTAASEAGAVKGSPAYMAPEMAEGRGDEVDTQTDVYLLGAILYEILTGRPPHHAESVYEMVELARLSTPAVPRALQPEVPPALEAICLKAMSRLKPDRYASTIDLADDVQRFLVNEPTSAYREGLAARTWRWCRKRRRWLLRATATAAVLCSVVIGTMAARHARELMLREQAAKEVKQIRQLADEALFFAANSDSLLEQAPYYDLQRGLDAGQQALALSETWGIQLERLPLPDQQPRLRQELYDLLLTMAQAQLHVSHDARSARSAVAHLDRARELRTPTRSYYRLSAEVAQALGQTRTAAAMLRKSLDPQCPTTALDHFLWAEEYRMRAVQRGHDEVDPIDWSVNESDLRRAIEEYRHALQLEPDHFWGHFQLGRCYLALQRPAEAVEALGTCIALRAETPWSYSTRGLALALLQRFPEAQRDLDRAVQLNPDFAPARLNRGVVAWLAEKPEEALTDFDTLLAAPPDQRLMEAAYYRGQIHVAAGNYEAALQDFNLLLELRPDFRPGYLSRANVRFLRNELEKGVEDVATLAFLTLPPASKREAWQLPYVEGRFLRRVWARFAWPNDEQKQAMLKLTEQKLATAMELGGKTATVLGELGAVWQLQGRWAEAVQAYSHGLLLAPDDVPLRVKRGWVYALGPGEQADAAESDFSAALELDPAHAEAYSGLGYLQAKAGHSAAAQVSASQALLFGSHDYLVLHNVACIYAELAAADPPHRQEFHAAALHMLQQGVTSWRTAAVRGPSALELAKGEPSFLHLRSTEAFQQLLE